MSDIVQILQAVSGGLWLLPAIYLLPRIVAAWRVGATRAQMLSAPIGFLSWLMVGFIVRWMAWPHAMESMVMPELVTWAALYSLSCLCALMVFSGALRTRGE